MRGGPPDPVDIHVGERLRARRSLLGMSQSKLAEAVGVTFQQVQKYERGANRVSASRLWQFSKILDTPINYFFSSIEGQDGIQQVLSEKPPKGFEGQEDIMERKETLDLIREYYSIPDPKLRKDLFNMIKTMASTMREES